MTPSKFPPRTPPPDEPDYAECGTPQVMHDAALRLPPSECGTSEQYRGIPLPKSYPEDDPAVDHEDVTL